MCQRRQKSVKPIAPYGYKKLWGNTNPNIIAIPIAQVEYPAKSKNICPEKASVPAHASQKWLKDRKGRELSTEDLFHYQKIIVALSETDRIMKEIDKIIVV